MQSWLRVLYSALLRIPPRSPKVGKAAAWSAVLWQWDCQQSYCRGCPSPSSYKAVLTPTPFPQGRTSPCLANTLRPLFLLFLISSRTTVCKCTWSGPSMKRKARPQESTRLAGCRWIACRHRRPCIARSATAPRRAFVHGGALGVRATTAHHRGPVTPGGDAEGRGPAGPVRDDADARARLRQR